MKLPINGGERIGWEYHNIILSRVPVYGFGIAVSGGRDNPHFMNGDPSIAISDVLKAGPAEGKLLVNDRVISANGVSLENVDYTQAIQILRDCGNVVNLLIKRRTLIPSDIASGSSNLNDSSMNNLVKVTLTKNNKKDDFGIVLGCKIYVKEIVNRNINADKENSLQEGDIIQKINNTETGNLTLKEAKKLLDNCKDKVTLTVVRRDVINQNFLNDNGNYINGHHQHSRTNSGLSATQMFRAKWQPPTGNGLCNELGAASSGHNTNANVIGNKDATNMAYGCEPLPNFAQGSMANNNNQNVNNASNVGATSGTSYNSNIAAMANTLANNGWSNQNLYVQPPTRNDSTVTANGNTSQNELNSRSREPVKDFGSNPEPDTPIDASPSKISHRPLPQKPVSNDEIVPAQPATINDANNNSLVLANDSLSAEQNARTNPNESDSGLTRQSGTVGEVRHIAFQKDGSVGIRLTGGNEVGIFVTAVQPGSPAYQQGLQVGDKILKANNVDMKDFTREEAVLYLLRIKDRIELYVQNCKEEYETIVAKQKGDSFYIRVHFNYDSEGKGELSFHVGDVFHVVDTLFNGVVGSWFVYRLGRNNQEIQKGSIPNKSRADELAAEQRLENRSKKIGSGTDLADADTSTGSRRGNFFKRRRSARRSKSLSKEHWEDIVFGDSSGSKFPAYERVTLKHPGFVRPVVLFGPLADIAREKLLRDFPEKFESPQALLSSGEDAKNHAKFGSSGIVRLSAIKQIVDQGKHALLDITPCAVDRLNYAQFYPIVIFMRVENKSVVKELRNRSSSKNTVHRSSRKLFEQSIKLEKIWHHIFTSSLTLTNTGDLWYKKLREIVDKQQSQTIWMSEYKPEESISDDFLFPMNSISRLSYASSPESDLDISANDDAKTGNDADDKDEDFIPSTGNRLLRSSSDSNLAQLDEPTATSETGQFDTFGDISPKPKEKSSSELRSQSKLPLHLLLKKQLSKAMAELRESKFGETKGEEKVASPPPPLQNPSVPESATSEYPKLKIGERISTNDGPMIYQSTPESPLPPPPPVVPIPTTSVSSSNQAKIQSQYLETPPRIDRNSKPTRFRSAHERLFGPNTSQPAVPTTIPCNNYQSDDADYINTTAFEYPEKPARENHDDHVNKYGSNLDPAQKNSLPRASDPYRFTRSTAQPITTGNSVGHHKQSSLERVMKPGLPPPPPLPPPPAANCKMEPTYPKTPPSPPPKPILLNKQYKMNSMMNQEPRAQSHRPYIYQENMYGENEIHHQSQQCSDYDNVPPIYPVKVLPKRVEMPSVSNGSPPGYYQSLPRSSFASSYMQKADVAMPRYSSHVEAMANFINGGNNYNNVETNNFNTIQRERPPVIGYGGESMMNTKYSYASNYDHIRYAGNTGTSGHYLNQNHQPPPPPSAMSYGANDNTYLNLPFNGRTFENPLGYHDVQPSPLPPPPPLPCYHQPQQHPSSRSSNNTPSHIVQPTPQRTAGPYLDLSLNRENRGSAFEVYRKPPTEPGCGPPETGDGQLFLPPPPPPLHVTNEFNHVNYTNIDEINSSTCSVLAPIRSEFESPANVIATARGIFGPEGGSLVSAETGVSIIIPPGAIPDSIGREIYFKVCQDKKLLPPLDRNKGETLLSPIVMCGPPGLQFQVPIELRLPHYAVVNPDSWSFALKSSDTNNGQPSGWMNISLGEQADGVNEQFVSVLVDHF